MSAETLHQGTIAWIAVAQTLPDVDTKVLVYAPGADEPVWLGFYDGVFWFAVDGGGCYGDEEEIAAAVVAWAPLPQGPDGYKEGNS